MCQTVILVGHIDDRFCGEAIPSNFGLLRADVHDTVMAIENTPCLGGAHENFPERSTLVKVGGYLPTYL